MPKRINLDYSLTQWGKENIEFYQEWGKFAFYHIRGNGADLELLLMATDNGKFPNLDYKACEERYQGFLDIFLKHIEGWEKLNWIKNNIK